MLTDKSEYTVNEERFYQNFGGRFPAVTRGQDPAVAPEHSAASDPKRITDTTLRDGAQQQGIALSVDDKIAIAEQLDDLGESEDPEKNRNQPEPIEQVK